MKFNKHSYKSNKLNKIKILKSYMSQIRRCYIHTYCVYVCVCVYMHTFFLIVCSECVLTYQVHDTMRYQKLGDM